MVWRNVSTAMLAIKKGSAAQNEIKWNEIVCVSPTTFALSLVCKPHSLIYPPLKRQNYAIS